MEGCSKNREVIFQKVRSSLALSGTGAWFGTRDFKSLFEAVMSLPAKYRTVIHLFYYEDYSVARIAEILHSREGTVKSQLNRGRQLLKTKLMEAWNDDE